MKLLNAFTPAMLEAFPTLVRFERVPEDGARVIALAGLESCIGHQGAADLYAAKLGVAVPMNRTNVKLVRGETALLGQYRGPRLPEGKVLTAEELDAAGIEWLLVKVEMYPLPLNLPPA